MLRFTLDFVSYEREATLARQIAVEAGSIALRYMQQGVSAEMKGDDSPVTIADREAEKAIVALLEKHFPDDGVMGEEGAARVGTSGRRWIIDPVDGTRDFVRGTERWAVLMGLEEFEGGPVLCGVAYFPVLEKSYVGILGGGAWCNDVRLRGSQISDIRKAIVHVNGLIKPDKMPYRDRLLDWCSQCFAVRSMGGGPDAMLLAEGKSDIWIEPDCKPWDLAPLKVILEEAGVRFFNKDGGSDIYGNNALACSPGLEDEVWKLIRG